MAAGYHVVAADVFNDMDTQSVAQAVPLGYVNGGFDADDVRRKLFPLLTADTTLVYGSGFETQSVLLQEIAQRCRLVGNDPKTVEVVKDPGRFFSMLAELDIPYPETMLAAPSQPDGWLSKRIGGSGGTHIIPAVGESESGALRYYQREMPGAPYSLLFFADGRQIQPVGLNAQYLAPAPDMPFRYGGAISGATLPEGVRTSMQEAAQKITARLGLRGLNSLDGMVDGDRWQVLEVNPRLSATFALYDSENSGAALFKAHLQACEGKLPPAWSSELSQAHLIYYAPFDFTVPAAMTWPDWVADVPEPASVFRAEEPLCTVMASAACADEACVLARVRMAALTALLTNLYQTMERS